MNSYIKLLPALGMLAISCSSRGTDNTESPMDFASATQVRDLVSEVLEPGGPGCAVAIFKDCKIVFKQGYGLANLDYGLPVTPATVFDIASISKQFTAACVLMLAQRNELSLNDDIRKFVPELPDYGHRIEIRHLLNHTSGIRDWVWLLTLAGIPFENVFTCQDLYKLIYRQKNLAFVPGDEFIYSNSGYNLLALIIERVSGMPLARFASREIFEPLGMKNTLIFDDRRLVIRNRALGYIPDERDGWLMEYYFNPAFVGSSNIHSTVEDLFLWDRNFYDKKVGPPDLAEMMETAGRLNDGGKTDYALGLRVGEYRGLRTAGHDGDWAGSYAYMLRFPEQRFTVVCLANTHTFSPRRLCYRIADLCLAEWHEMELPDQQEPKVDRKPVVVDPSLYNKYTGEYVAENGGKITIRRDKDKLVGRLPGSRAFELLPLSETEFFPDGQNAIVSFLHDEPESVGRIEWRQGQSTIIYRDSPFKFSTFDMPGNADDYAGDYYSEELQVSYRIIKAERGLILNSPIRSRYMMEMTGITGNDPLVPVEKNAFRFAFLQVRFERDKADRVTGFTLIHPYAKLYIEFVRL